MQHAVTLENLKLCALPDEQLSLLQSSAQIGKAQRNQGDILNDFHMQDYNNDGHQANRAADTGPSVSMHPGSLAGTAWRSKNRKRKRRLLKAEKVMCKPRLAAEVATEGSSGCSSCSEGEEGISEDHLAAEIQDKVYENPMATTTDGKVKIPPSGTFMF